MSRPPPGITISIDLPCVVANALAINALTNVPQYAVVKADAYGLGAVPISRALAPHVHGFYVFDLAESRAARLADLGKPIIALDHPWKGYGESDYRDARVRPIVHSVERAAELKFLSPVLSIDTGMHRFGLPPAQWQTAVAAGGIKEIMTHASRLEQVDQLVALCGGQGFMLHAAATSLLGESRAHLNAVRPGLALYRGAMTASSPILEVHTTSGPAGYTRFSSPRIGIILGGYTNGLKPGLCLLNGARRRILEVGMQSAFVELGPGDAVGDQAFLLCKDLPESEVAKIWGIGEHEVLVRLGRNQVSP